ncbi:MAG TPA: DUF1467 family protein [Paracoccaceae bacterium]|jgi:predicted secreted protein|nr:DUF1467 family protein [Paracoccaceae bacterium]
MDTTLAIGIYIFIWWITLFAVLPFGVRTQQEAGEVVPGTPESAPEKPRLLRVFAINTIVATIVFAVVYSAIVFRWINIENIPYP